MPRQTTEKRLNYLSRKELQRLRSAWRELPEDFRVSLALRCKNARLEPLRGIAGKNRDLSLQNGRTVVVFVVHEVDRAARKRFAGGDHRFVDLQTIHSFAAESREQRRMNVDHAVLKVGWNANVLEKAAHHHILHAGCSAGFENRFAKFFVAYSFFLFDD